MGGPQGVLSQGSLAPPEWWRVTSVQDVSEWVGATSFEMSFSLFKARRQDPEGEVQAAFSFSSNRIHSWKGV